MNTGWSGPLEQDNSSGQTVADAPPILQFRPSSPGPLLVIIPSIFGVSKDVAYFGSLFQTYGALVYAMNPFWRDGKGPLRIPEDSPQAMARMKQVSDDHVLKDLLAICAAGRQDALCNGQLLLLGVCFGGRFTLKASQHIAVDGIAIWHGAGLGPALSTKALTQTVISMDFGSQDPLIPLTEVDALKASLRQLDASVRVHEDCGHGFTHWGTNRCVPEAANNAAQAVIDMIARFVGRP